MRPDNYLLKDAARMLKPKYTKTYKAVMAALIISTYAYGYYLSWSSFEATL